MDVQPSDAVSLLAEMFPNVSTSELVHCLSLASGSVDVATQHILERMDMADEQCSSPVEQPVLVFSYYRNSYYGRPPASWPTAIIFYC